jgi:hypothetical protein
VPSPRVWDGLGSGRPAWAGETLGGRLPHRELHACKSRSSSALTVFVHEYRREGGRYTAERVRPRCPDRSS